MADGYNGWSNRATWNVSLWLSNEEAFYNDVNRLARRHGPDEDDSDDDRVDAIEEFANALESFCNEIWPDGVTPDDDALSECDFAEVAASWLED